MFSTFEFYRDVYGGAGSEDDYNRYRQRVDARINAMTNHAAEAAIGGSDERVKTLLQFAHAAGVDAYRITDGGTGAIQSESTDGYSVTYARSERSAARLIDGAMLEYLRQTGLVSTWI